MGVQELFDQKKKKGMESGRIDNFRIQGTQ